MFRSKSRDLDCPAACLFSNLAVIMDDDNLQLNIATDADFGRSAAKRAKKSTRRSYSFKKHQVSPIL